MASFTGVLFFSLFVDWALGNVNPLGMLPILVCYLPVLLAPIHIVVWLGIRRRPRWNRPWLRLMPFWMWSVTLTALSVNDLRPSRRLRCLAPGHVPSARVLDYRFGSTLASGTWIVAEFQVAPDDVDGLLQARPYQSVNDPLPFGFVRQLSDPADVAQWYVAIDESRVFKQSFAIGKTAQPGRLIGVCDMPH